MSGSVDGSEGKPNLTPVLDMVFQLITFFMLVINFQTNSIDKHMDLPVVGSARPVKNSGTFMMVNVNNKGQFTVFGKPMSDDQIPGFVAREAQVNRLAVRRTTPNFTDEDDLPTVVIVRADKDTPFSKLSKIIKICQDNGFRNFAFRAKQSGS